MNVCLECGRDTRPHGYTIVEKPGTVEHYGRGLCRACWSRHYRAGTLDTAYPLAKDNDKRAGRGTVVPRDKTTPCENCGKAMRPYDSLATDWPGSVQRKGRTCSGCTAARGRGQLIPADSIERMREDLKNWFHSRGRDWTKAGFPA